MPQLKFSHTYTVVRKTPLCLTQLKESRFIRDWIEILSCGLLIMHLMWCVGRTMTEGRLNKGSDTGTQVHRTSHQRSRLPLIQLLQVERWCALTALHSLSKTFYIIQIFALWNVGNVRVLMNGNVEPRGLFICFRLCSCVCEYYDELCFRNTDLQRIVLLV